MSSTLLETCQEVVPETAGELRRFVRENGDGPQLPLYPAGGRTSLSYGFPAVVPGKVISLSKLSQVVDYPARDMTITVEAGVRMDDLAAELQKERQQLPVDAPQPNRATLGGVLATNTSGPRRYGYGTMRDYVIGITAVDGRGRLFHAGGRVVKNVAGYDLSKLMVGSLGTLAIVTQVTLKLRPIPETSALLWATFPSFQKIEEALQDLVTSAAQPVILDVLNAVAARQVAAEARQGLPAERPVLTVGVEGSGREVDWQLETLKQEIGRHGPEETCVAKDGQVADLLNALTEFQTASDDPLTFRAGLRPSRTVHFIERATECGVSVQSHAGNGVVVGHLPDEASTVEKAAEILNPLRALARESRGNLVILNCESEWKQTLPVFGDPEPSWPLMQRLKQSLDPHGVLNPGRLWRGDDQLTPSDA